MKKKVWSLVLTLCVLWAFIISIGVSATENLNEETGAQQSAEIVESTENIIEELSDETEKGDQVELNSEKKEETKLSRIGKLFDVKRVFELSGSEFIKGLEVTILSTVLSLLIALVLGLVFCFMSLSKVKILNWISKFYLWIIRGTPLIVLGLMFYFALPQAFAIFGVRLRWADLGGVFTVSVIVLSLNAGAYMSEIFRAGMLAVPKGQEEAARSLGLSKGKALRKVILPQAIKVAIPSLVNQCIITLKDTSILAALGLGDLVYHAKNTATQGGALATYTVLAAFYLIVVTVLTILSHYLERKTDYARKSSNN